MTLVLGIETSCDETGVGLVADGVLVGEALASSMDEHAVFGGVVPEVAARAHMESFVRVLRAALVDGGVGLEDIGAVAVTAGPGLASSLHVGVAAGKALGASLGVPVHAVHHLAGHVAADTLVHGPLPDPSVVLIVSGRHTSLLLVRDLATSPILHLGDTLDDAAGEAFDKVAQILDLGYPGGPAISRVAADGDPTAVPFPRGLAHERGDRRFAFSFSGLQTATARYAEREQAAGARPCGGGRRRLVPGSRGRRPHRQGGRRLPRAPHRHAGDRRRGGGQPPAGRGGGRAVHPCRHRAADTPATPVHRQRRDDRGGGRPSRACRCFTLSPHLHNGSVGGARPRRAVVGGRVPEIRTRPAAPSVAHVRMGDDL